MSAGCLGYEAVYVTHINGRESLTVADGVLLWLCNPHCIRDVVVPCVREGRERAGRTLEGFGGRPGEGHAGGDLR